MKPVGTFDRDLNQKFWEQHSILDFINPTAHKAIQNGTSTADFTAQINAYLSYIGNVKSGGRAYFPEGLYPFVGPVTAPYQNIRIGGSACGSTILKHTGAGVAVTLGSETIPNTSPPTSPPTTLDGYYGLGATDFTIQGNAATTAGLKLIRARGKVDNVRVVNVGGIGMDFLGCISLYLNNPRVTANEGGATINTTTGMHFGRTVSDALICQDISTHHPLIEATVGRGLDLEYCNLMNVFGATSEGHGSRTPIGGGVGVYIGPNSSLNRFYGLDFEVNPYINTIITAKTSNTVFTIGTGLDLCPGQMLATAYVGGSRQTIISYNSGTGATVVDVASPPWTIAVGAHLYAHMDIDCRGLSNSFYGCLVVDFCRIRSGSQKTLLFDGNYGAIVVDSGARQTAIIHTTYGINYYGKLTDNAPDTLKMDNTQVGAAVLDTEVFPADVWGKAARFGPDIGNGGLTVGPWTGTGAAFLDVGNNGPALVDRSVLLRMFADSVSPNGSFEIERGPGINSAVRITQQGTGNIQLYGPAGAELGHYAAAPTISYTDLVIDGADAHKATSAANPFSISLLGAIQSTAMIVTGGTGFTHQTVLLTGVTAAGVATFDTLLGTLGSTGGIATITQLDQQQLKIGLNAPGQGIIGGMILGYAKDRTWPFQIVPIYDGVSVDHWILFNAELVGGSRLAARFNSTNGGFYIRIDTGNTVLDFGRIPPGKLVSPVSGATLDATGKWRSVGGTDYNDLLRIIAAVSINATTPGTKNRLLLLNDTPTVSAGSEIVFSAHDTSDGNFCAVGVDTIGNNGIDAAGNFYVATKASTHGASLVKYLTINSVGDMFLRGRIIPGDGVDGFIEKPDGSAHLLHFTNTGVKVVGTLFVDSYLYGGDGTYFNIVDPANAAFAITVGNSAVTIWKNLVVDTGIANKPAKFDASKRLIGAAINLTAAAAEVTGVLPLANMSAIDLSTASVTGLLSTTKGGTGTNYANFTALVTAIQSALTDIPTSLISGVLGKTHLPSNGVSSAVAGTATGTDAAVINDIKTQLNALIAALS